MKTHQFVVFFLVVFSVYFAGNLYIFFKGYNILPPVREKRLLYTIIFIALAITFIAAKILESRHSSVLTDILNIIGGFWMAFMLYGFLIWLTADILFLLQSPFRLIPDASVPRIRLWLFGGITVTTLILIIAGFINAVIPIIKRYDLTVDKRFSNGTSSMQILAVSDIHLGSVIRKRSMRHLSGMISNEKPDLVLFLGDIIDGSIGPVLRGDLLSHLKLPYLPEGNYAITGNHEYIGGLSKTLPYIESKGIRVLQDEVVTLGNGVQLIGRLDRSAIQGSGKGRASLDSLLDMTDRTRPVILLDHQPFGLSDLAGTPVDLQLSGHTHNGQMWPLTYITSKMFEVSHGYGKFGNTHVIVSSGFGLWGPRMRLGTRPEIVVIALRSSL